MKTKTILILISCAGILAGALWWYWKLAKQVNNETY